MNFVEAHTKLLGLMALEEISRTTYFSAVVVLAAKAVEEGDEEEALSLTDNLTEAFVAEELLQEMERDPEIFAAAIAIAALLQDKMLRDEDSKQQKLEETVWMRQGAKA